MTDRCFLRRSQGIWCFGDDPSLLRPIGGLSLLRPIGGLGFDW